MILDCVTGGHSSEHDAGRLKSQARLHPCGIGEGLRVKVTANIGTSSDRAQIHELMPLGQFTKVAWERDVQVREYFGD
ncbi:MAG: hypothetical protein JRJ09_00110 [Deltaproteobacteria bacterium]|nr:hypothetical protein [Deltaproteobacteria bacterium]MBW2046919.1 hypothetical protein [Deltaproteobacteria bacterium]MBW2110964.1 hypothetical protein [Deltaproteobacteria bacterium]MBW2351726.1 hypothetical protein [Deltaproteobacteria bacterium]